MKLKINKTLELCITMSLITIMLSGCNSPENLEKIRAKGYNYDETENALVVSDL